MPILYVFEPECSTFSVSDLPGDNQMPHVRRFFFPVSDFVRGAYSAVAWTDRRALSALDALAAAFPAPFCVEGAFRRWPDKRRSSGLCFSLSAENLPRLRGLCLESRLFSYVSPPFLGGRTLLVTVSVPTDRSAGVHVFSLQDALMHAGLYAGPLTGTLTGDTRSALMRLTNTPLNAKI